MTFLIIMALFIVAVGLIYLGVATPFGVRFMSALLKDANIKPQG